MKRILIPLLLTAALLLAGCGFAEEEEKVQMVNPLRESTAEEILQELGIAFTVPQGVEDTKFFIINTEDGAIAEMRFVKDGVNGTFRILAADVPGESLPDISGMFFEWQKQAEAMVGYNDAELTWNEGAEGVIRWYDYAPGLLYSISLSSAATADSLVELAELLYQPVQGDVDATAEPSDRPELQEILADISGDYQFGVLGSSLRAAQYAAMLSDRFSAEPVDRKAVDAAVIDFLSTLEAEELESFPEKFRYVDTAMEELFGEQGEGLLSDCGYEPTHAPWDEETMRACFDMIWEIVGSAE